MEKRLKSRLASRQRACSSPSRAVNRPVRSKALMAFHEEAINWALAPRTRF